MLFVFACFTGQGKKTHNILLALKDVVWK